LKPVVEIGKLMHHSLAPALALDRARIMARGMKREQRESAGVPAPEPDSALLVRLILDVKANAGRAHERASAASETSERLFQP